MRTLPSTALILQLALTGHLSIARLTDLARVNLLQLSDH
jgi:hypothetical protein